MASQPAPRIQSVKHELNSLFLLVAGLAMYGAFAAIQLWRAGKYQYDSSHFHDWGFYAVMYGLMISFYCVVTLVVLLRLRHKLKALLPGDPFSSRTPSAPQPLVEPTP